MKYRVHLFSLFSSLAWVVAPALVATSISNADDAEVLIFDAQPQDRIQRVLIPAPAPAPAIRPPQPAARLKPGTKITWLDCPILYPTLLPNPIGFNVTWIAMTNRQVFESKALVNRQNALAARRAAVARQPLPNKAAQNAIQQQMRKFLEPMLMNELSFAARTTDLNRDERRKLTADGKAWFEKFIVDFVGKQDPNQQRMILQGMQGVWFGNQQRRPENPRDAIRVGVDKLVKDTLSKERSAAYTDECRKRDEFARQALVDNMVERIDEKVKLPPEQWRKLATVLGDHWDKNWEPQIEALAMNTPMWPGEPLQWVLRELSPAQQAALKRVNRGSTRIIIRGGAIGQMLGGNGAVFNDMEDDAEPDSKVAKPAKKAPAEIRSEAD